MSLFCIQPQVVNRNSVLGKSQEMQALSSRKSIFSVENFDFFVAHE